MARVQQTTIDKALKAIRELMDSPMFPSRDELLESNRTLCNVVALVRVRGGDIPEKTICGLLVEALDLRNDVTGEALWKRYRRATTNKDGSGMNKDTGSDTVSPENIVGNSIKDGSNVNGDASEQLFIPPGISQIDLAAGIAEYFESQGYNSASLLKTCLMAMDEMAVRMEVSEIKSTVDARYRPQDDVDIEEIES